MKVAVASTGTDLDARTDPRFGRCQAFVVVDTDTMGSEGLANSAAMQGSGAGIAVAQLVAGTGADAVVADNLGPNSFQALSAGGLKVFRFSGGTVRQAVEALVAGRLEEIGGANVPPHHGMGAPTPRAPHFTEKADSLDAQVQDLRRQIEGLQAKPGQGS